MRFPFFMLALAGAEADLEMERARIAKQAFRGERPRFGNAQSRQQPLDQLGLVPAQRPALGAAVEPANGGGIVHFSFGPALLDRTP